MTTTKSRKDAHDQAVAAWVEKLSERCTGDSISKAHALPYAMGYLSSLMHSRGYTPGVKVRNAQVILEAVDKWMGWDR